MGSERGRREVEVSPLLSPLLPSPLITFIVMVFIMISS